MKTKRLFSRVLAALVLMLPGWVVAQSVVSLNDYTPAWNVGGFNSIEATATAAGNVLVGDTATIAVANFGTTEHPVDFGDTAYVAPFIKVTPNGEVILNDGRGFIRPLYKSTGVMPNGAGDTVFGYWSVDNAITPRLLTIEWNVRYGNAATAPTARFQMTMNVHGTIEFYYGPINAATAVNDLYVGMEDNSVGNPYTMYLTNPWNDSPEWDGSAMNSTTAHTLLNGTAQGSIPNQGNLAYIYTFHRYCYHTMEDYSCDYFATNPTAIYPNYQWNFDYIDDDATKRHYYLRGTGTGNVTSQYNGPIFNIDSLYIASAPSHDMLLSYLIVDSNDAARGYRAYYTERCEHIGLLTLHIGVQSHRYDTVSACDNYVWFNRVYNNDVPNDTVHHGLNDMRCDSVYHINLTINHSSSKDISGIGCDLYKFEWANYDGTDAYMRDYKNSIDTTIIVKNAVGCDSTIHLVLDIRATTYDTVVDTACDQYMWRLADYDGTSRFTRSFTANTDSTLIVRNMAGCDSVCTLQLTVFYKDSVQIDTVVTDFVNYEITDLNGVTTNNPIYWSDTYRYVIETKHGCDSIIKVKAVVYHTLADSVICGGWFRNVYYPIDTTLYDTIFTQVDIAGIGSRQDNAVRAYHIIPRQFNIVRVWSTDALTWLNGVTYTTSTLASNPPYHNNTSLINGCDSTWFLYYQKTAGPVHYCADDDLVYNGYTINTTTSTTVFNEVQHITDTIKFVSMPGSMNAVADTIQFSVDGATSMHDVDSMYVYDFDYIIYNYETPGANNYVMGAFDTVIIPVPFEAPSTPVALAYGDSSWVYTLDYNDTTSLTKLVKFISQYGCDSVVSVTFTIEPSCVVYDTLIQNYCLEYTDNSFKAYNGDNTLAYTLSSQSLVHANAYKTAHPGQDTNIVPVYDTIHIGLKTAYGCDSALTLIMAYRGIQLDTMITDTNSDGHYLFNGVQYNVPSWAQELDTTIYYSDGTTNEFGCDITKMKRLLIGRTNDSSWNVDTCQLYAWTVGILVKDQNGEWNTYDSTRYFRFRTRDAASLGVNPWYDEVDSAGNFIRHIDPAYGQPSIRHLQNDMTFDSVDYLILTLAEGTDSMIAETYRMRDLYRDSLTAGATSDDRYEVVFYDTDADDATVTITDTVDFFNARMAMKDTIVDLRHSHHYNPRWCDSIVNVHMAFKYDSVHTYETITLYYSDLAANATPGLYNYGTTTVVNADRTLTSQTLDFAFDTVFANKANGHLDTTIVYPMENGRPVSVVDSIVHLSINVIYNYDTIAPDTICITQTQYTLPLSNTNVTTRPANGDVDTAYSFDYLVTNNGVPTMYHHDVYQLRRLYGTLYVVACDSYTWDDMTYDAFGNPHRHGNGETYTASTTIPTYTLVGESVNGCDSVVTLNLTILNNGINVDPDTVVACDSYTWEGFTDADTAAITVTSANDLNIQGYIFGGAANGCDSIATLNITINHSIAVDLYDTVANTLVTMNGTPVTYTYSWEDHIISLTEPTADTVVVIKDTLSRVLTGCDSIATMHVLFHAPTYIDTVVYLCYDNVHTGYVWDRQSAHGAFVWDNTDSVFRNSVVAPNEWESGDTVDYYVASTYFTSDANDTVYRLILNVSQNSYGVDPSVHACDSYDWYVTYPTAFFGQDSIAYAGTYYESFHAPYSPSFVMRNHPVSHCDSIVYLELTIDTTVHAYDTVYTCGDTYDLMNYVIYDGDTLVEGSNVITRTAYTGCDSLVHVMVDVIRPVYDTVLFAGYDGMTSAPDTLICLGSDFTYTQRGHNIHWTYGVDYTVDGLYTDTATIMFNHGNVSCVDTISILYVRVLPSSFADTLPTSCSLPYEWKVNETNIRLAARYGHAAPAPRGVFTATVFTEYADTTNTTIITNHHGCDSIISVSFHYGTNPIINEYETVCEANLPYSWTDPHTAALITINGDTTFSDTVSHPTETCKDTVYIHHFEVAHPVNQNLAVTECDSYTWNGVTYTASETVSDTLTSVEGCDSVYRTMEINIKYSDTSNVVVTACDSYVWDKLNYTYTTSTYGDHFDTVAANGCDSTIYLYLTINNSVSYDTNITACNSYLWDANNATYTVSGIYSATLHNASVKGCDSVVNMTLTINQTQRSVVDTIVCNSFVHNNAIYLASTQIVDTLVGAAVNGCDSIVTYNVTVNNPDTVVTTAVACDSYTWKGQTYTSSITTAVTTAGAGSTGCGLVEILDLTVNYSDPVTYMTVTTCDSYDWNGTTYTASASVVDTFMNRNACDSIVELQLTVYYSDTVVVEATACDTYTWYGVTYAASTNTPVHRLQTLVGGCDSIQMLHLTINYSTTSTDVISACSSYTWDATNITYTTSGLDTAHLTNLAGCDSTAYLFLTIYQPDTVNIYQTACDSYQWTNGSGLTYTASGSYPYTITGGNVHGCDSTTILNLTINQSKTGAETHTACDSYTWNGTTYTTSTTATHQFYTSAGCDSIATLYLTINNSTTGSESATACDSYTWHGTVYTASTNAATYTTTNAAGCDSVVTLNLTINHSTANTVTATACDSYTWHGTVYTASNNTATYTTTNAAGCDSVVTLHLTVNYSSTGLETANVCDSYTWHGTVYTESTNAATYTTTNAAGCDSVVTLHLTIRNSTTNTETATACDSYTWHGTVYNASNNTATYTTTNAAGCDSVVTLNLTINNSVTTTDAVTECDSYTWAGTTYTNSGVYTGNFQTVHGCDSTVTLTLTINNSTSSEFSVSNSGAYTWNGQTYATGGDYQQTFTAANGCDSVVTLHLSIINGVPVPSIVAYNGKVLMVNHYPYGKDNAYVEYDNYQWYKNGVAIDNATVDFYNEANYADLDGCYYVMANKDNSDWVMSNVLCFGDNNDIDDVETMNVTFTVAPNPVANGQLMRVETNLDEAQLQGAQLTMYDLRGRIVMQQPMEQSSVVIRVQQPTGAYMLRLVTKSGDLYVKKVVVK